MKTLLYLIVPTFICVGFTSVMAMSEELDSKTPEMYYSSSCPQLNYPKNSVAAYYSKDCSTVYVLPPMKIPIDSVVVNRMEESENICHQLKSYMVEEHKITKEERKRIESIPDEDLLKDFNNILKQNVLLEKERKNLRTKEEKLLNIPVAYIDMDISVHQEYMVRAFENANPDIVAKKVCKKSPDGFSKICQMKGVTFKAMPLTGLLLVASNRNPLKFPNAISVTETDYHTLEVKMNESQHLQMELSANNFCFYNDIKDPALLAEQFDALFAMTLYQFYNVNLSSPDMPVNMMNKLESSVFVSKKYLQKYLNL